MKKVLLIVLALFLISGTAHAVSYTVTDVFDTFTKDSVDDYNWLYGSDVDTLSGTGDYVTWTHSYEFDPEAASIISATLTLSLYDDEKDSWGRCELAIGYTEAGEWALGEVDTDDYEYDISLSSLLDGSFTVTLASLWGDFSIESSTLRIEYEAAPVPEPATMLLLGTGLIGLAAGSRKKIFKK